MVMVEDIVINDNNDESDDFIILYNESGISNHLDVIPLGETY
jgi:hypothetical protein